MAPLLLPEVVFGLMPLKSFAVTPLIPPGTTATGGSAVGCVSELLGADNDGGEIVLADSTPTALAVAFIGGGTPDVAVVAVAPFVVTIRLCCCCISLTAEAACMLTIQLLPLIWKAAFWAPNVNK